MIMRRDFRYSICCMVPMGMRFPGCVTVISIATRRSVAWLSSWHPQKILFYQDLKSGKKYKTFFTEELPVFIQSVFPVTKDREKTYIAGFSMGGYGAWYLGLSRPDLYAKAASMSGALDIAGLYESATIQENENNPFSWEDSFGDPKKLSGSKYDLFALYDQGCERWLCAQVVSGSRHGGLFIPVQSACKRSPGGKTRIRSTKRTRAVMIGISGISTFRIF